jgi:hypothetical protein
MDRYISTIISKFSILLGFNSRENCVSGLAIQISALRSLVRSLGLRYSSASIMAGSRVAVTSRVSSASAGAGTLPVHKNTGVLVPQHCWRPAQVGRHVSEQ